ncbi:MAG: thioredoxin family protein [Pyrinomonadaceae bacterium]
MNIKRVVFAAFLAASVTLVSGLSSFAQDAMKSDDGMKKEGAMMMEDKRPVVAIIAAEWCPYCKRIDPVVKEVMAAYSEKLNFVMFDVTDERTKAAAMETAKKLGLLEFFDEYKGKTSTVAVLKDKKIVYKTSNNGNKGDYVKAFDKALK